MGIYQIGKSFRNEINPSKFLYRLREFTQMELEFLTAQEEANYWYSTWLDSTNDWLSSIGLKNHNLRRYVQEKSELAHYSQGTTDIEYKFPFGWGEICGVSNRGSFDINRHTESSKVKLNINFNNGETALNVIEPSLGLDRIIVLVWLLYRWHYYWIQ